MKKLVFATSNAHKVREVKEILGNEYEIVSLKDIGCHEDIPETSPDFAGNALQKARYVKTHYDLDCFAEDTGLVVDALDGAPGVMTARYSGPERDPIANMDLVISQLEGKTDRSARFTTAIALLLEGEEYIFEGKVEGSIRKNRSGEGGFGYDPIFEPQGYSITFAEMDATEKNKISHRGRAIKKLIDFLKEKE